MLQKNAQKYKWEVIVRSVALAFRDLVASDLARQKHN